VGWVFLFRGVLVVAVPDAGKVSVADHVDVVAGRGNDRPVGPPPTGRHVIALGMRDALAADRGRDSQHLGTVAREGSGAKDGSDRMGRRVGARRFPAVAIKGLDPLLEPDEGPQTGRFAAAIDGVGVEPGVRTGCVALALDDRGALDGGADAGLDSVALDGFASLKVHRCAPFCVVASVGFVHIVFLVAKDGIRIGIEQDFSVVGAHFFELILEIDVGGQ